MMNEYSILVKAVDVSRCPHYILYGVIILEFSVQIYI